MYIDALTLFTAVARNLGLPDYRHFEDAWLEWAFEAEKFIGSNETYQIAEASYTKTGAKASATFTFTGQPESGDYIDLNGARLYFRNPTDLGGAKSPNELTIGTNLEKTLNNNSATDPGLLEKLSGKFLNQQGIFAQSLPNTPAFVYPEALQRATYAVDTTANTLTVTAKEIGIKGNKFEVGVKSSNITVDSNYLSGGKGVYANQQIKLPENLIKLLAVRVGSTDKTHQHKELRETSSIHTGRLGKDANDTIQRAFRYYIEGNRLNIGHDNLDDIVISYLEYPTDLRGWPMFKKSHTTAVAHYVMWQHKLIDYYNAKVPQYIIKDLERRWYQLCAKARGDDNMPSSPQIRQIGNMWNTLVPLTNNRGLIDF